MNYLKGLIVTGNRPLITVPFKYFSTSDGADFQHLADKSVFLLKLPEGIAQVKYTKENGTLNLSHTIVPDKYRGKGVGKIIAKNVLQYCLERNIKVRLTCEFLIEFTKHNQEYNKIILPSV